MVRCRSNIQKVLCSNSSLIVEFFPKISIRVSLLLSTGIELEMCMFIIVIVMVLTQFFNVVISG